MVPDYKKIYTQILEKKFPNKKEEFIKTLQKEEFSSLDIIKINQKIFGTSSKETKQFNQMHRSYNEKAIIEILTYQKRNNFKNSQIADHFKISRNTIAKWKKEFHIELL